MRRKDTVTLFLPVGEDDFGTVWKRVVIKGAVLITKKTLDGAQSVLYVDGSSRAYCGGAAESVPEISPGCALAAGIVGTPARFLNSLPEDAEICRVTAVTERKTSRRTGHVKATLA